MQAQMFYQNHELALYTHYVKSVRIRSYSGPYFPALYLSVFIPNVGKYGPE